MKLQGYSIYQEMVARDWDTALKLLVDFDISINSCEIIFIKDEEMRITCANETSIYSWDEYSGIERFDEIGRAHV